MSITTFIRSHWDALSETTQEWAIRSGRRGKKERVASWEAVAYAVVTYADGAYDVLVEVGEDCGYWFIRTTDDAGGGDDGDDDTAYADREAAMLAAQSLALDLDEGQDGEDAAEYLDRTRREAIESARDASGSFALVSSQTGRRWDTHRYASQEGAEKARRSWFSDVAACYPGVSPLWDLMDCPEVAGLNEDTGEWVVIIEDDE